MAWQCKMNLAQRQQLDNRYQACHDKIDLYADFLRYLPKKSVSRSLIHFYESEQTN